MLRPRTQAKLETNKLEVPLAVVLPGPTGEFQKCATSVPVHVSAGSPGVEKVQQLLTMEGGVVVVVGGSLNMHVVISLQRMSEHKHTCTSLLFLLTLMSGN